MLQALDAHLMVAETLRMADHCFGKQPDVVAKAFSHDVEVTSGLERRLPDFASHTPQIGLVRFGSFQAIEPPIHVAFELGDRHRLAREAHHNIVRVLRRCQRRHFELFWNRVNAINELQIAQPGRSQFVDKNASFIAGPVV